MEHRKHVRQVLNRLQENQLYAKIEKCTFETTRIEYLGFIITPGHIEMDPKKVEAILQWPTPTSVKAVQRFVGFANYYRRFINSFSRIIRPITQLTTKQNRFQWTPQAQHAFELLKQKFTTAPILVLPDPEKPYFLEVDASETAVGAVLSQRHGEKDSLHPVSFYSNPA
ncbi:uncharacterized protein LOC128491323 [Spea bombifrons]|uniref:uncharacterized protein LOC128491323 n=1 Tax=Spea bombifrons TaxID=233779 RepID=UPI00234B1581|nr:uncharacterized protein LOC128491323 [Spea bombifrons]